MKKNVQNFYRFSCQKGQIRIRTNIPDPTWPKSSGSDWIESERIRIHNSGRNPTSGTVSRHQYLIAEIVVHLDERCALPSHFLQLLLHTFQLSAQLVRLLSATQVKMFLFQISSRGSWVDKLGRWVAKLVARLLATAALWVQIQISLKKLQSGRHKQRSVQHNLARQKKDPHRLFNPWIQTHTAHRNRA